MGEGNESRDEIRVILTEWLKQEGKEPPDAWKAIDLHVDLPPANDDGPDGSKESSDSRYDFDLAEFPLFSLHKNSISTKGREPLVYTDTITGQDGKAVTRTWKTYPGAFGFGGSTAQVLLYDLLQLYCEQGARGAQIEFGTLRSLFRRHSDRNPTKGDYD